MRRNGGTHGWRGWAGSAGGIGAAVLLSAAGLALSVRADDGHVSGSPKAPVTASAPAANVPAGVRDAPEGDGAARVVRVFDFEEPENPDPVPRSWFRAQDAPPDRRRPGFPAFNQAEFDGARAFSGNRSVRLPTRGGGVALRLSPGEIPVFADADYQVSAMVRTTDLEHARAFLVARLLDQQLRPIPGTDVRSEPVRSADGWTSVSILIPGADARGSSGTRPAAAAAWLQIDLELLQPRQFADAPPITSAPAAAPAAEGTDAGVPAPESFRIWREDVEGAAWFDDVTVGLVPRTFMGAGDPESADATGIFLGEQTPRIWVQVRDLGGRELTGHVRVLDLRGREVDAWTGPLEPSGREQMVTPRLPGFGWYRALLEVRAAGGAVARRESWFLWLPAREPAAERALIAPDPGRADGGMAGPERQRFGVAMDTLPEAALPALPDFLNRLGTRMVILPAFDAETTPGDARTRLDARAATLEALMARGQDLTLAITRIPAGMDRSLPLEPDDVLGMFLRSNGQAPWKRVLEPTLDVYGQRIVRYQAGMTGGRSAVLRDPAGGARALDAELSKMVPGPSVALAVGAERPPPAGVGREPESSAGSGSVGGRAVIDALTLTYPSSFATGEIGRALRRFAEEKTEHREEREITFVPQLPDARTFGFEARVVEAGRRIAEFWAQAGGGIGPEPGGPPARVALGGANDACWRTVDGPGGRVRIEPGAELGVLACMTDRLAGRRVIARLPSAEGVTAYLLAEPLGADRYGRTGIIAWCESATAPEARVEAVAGDAGAVRVYDLFGNPLTGDWSAGAAPGASVSVDVGEAPVFIEGVDPYLSLLTTSFRIEPSFVPAIVAEHEHTVRLRNPWPIRISGRLQLKPSEDDSARRGGAEWRITPNVMEFSLAPGEEAALPVSLSFGAGQLGGKKDFVIVARVQADKAYPAVRLKETLEIGLPDLALEPEVQLGPGPNGPDVLVIAAVTNKDSKPRTIRLEATARGRSSQQLQISDLPPGQTALKRFVFKDAAKDLSGLRVLVTLSDSEGAARLNKAVAVP